MKILLKILSFLLGVVAIGAVVWLGYLTANNQSPQLVAIFGVSSALVAPIGLALIGYVFKSSDREMITRLAKVPEIEKLVEEANSQEEKIKLLERQKQQLAEIIQFESRRQSLINRKETNEREAVRLLSELKAIDIELNNLNIAINENKEISEELEALRKRIEARQRGDFVFTFGSFSFVLETDILLSLPLGRYLYDILFFERKIADSLIPKIRMMVEKLNPKNSSN